MRVVLIDHGAGNIRSVAKALSAAGVPAVRSDRPEDAVGADALVLPGQGHFGQVMAAFRAGGFESVVRDHLREGRPFLGICVGLQLLMEGSEEAPGTPGLGLLSGRVVRFPAGEVSVPHMGWNVLRQLGDPPLLAGVPDGAHAYFAHSYVVTFDDEAGPAGGWATLPEGSTGAVTEYGPTRFLSAFSLGNVHATQFHPEKSQSVGLKVLSNFVAAAKAAVQRQGAA